MADVEQEKQPRLCYITPRNVSNIAADYGLLDGRTNSDDRASLKSLIEDHESIAAVKLIETDDLSCDRFLLAFVTSNGKKYRERYGHRGLVFDDTFNVSRYSFRLATLVVSDDGGNGFPCAHLLFFRMSAAEVEVLFELVKECVPQFEPQYIMTDDTYVFYRRQSSVLFEQSSEDSMCVSYRSKPRKKAQHSEESNVPTANLPLISRKSKI
ncbi:hypothetical protein Aduo_009177 [Ancylostoma duodenale]